MGDFTQQKRTIIICPLCGESLQGSPQESSSHCPSCEFNFNLLISQEKAQIPQTEQPYIPNLAFWILGIQIIFSGFFIIAYLFFAAPLYYLVPQLIAALHLFTIIILGLFAIALHKRKGLTLIRIGLMIIGIVSLPLGVFAIAASSAISPLKRICIICRKQIRWAAHVECPHCQASMHRYGSCRNRRLQVVTAALGSKPLISQLDFVCPNCHHLMQSNANGGKLDG